MTGKKNKSFCQDLETRSVRNVKNGQWTRIETLGESRIDSPLLGGSNLTDASLPGDAFVDDSCRVLVNHSLAVFRAFKDKAEDPDSFEEAGARRKIYFNPSKVRAAILTAGGLCPGLNDVIRSIVMTLYYRYGVRTVWGIRYGYQGLSPRYAHEFMPLDPKKVTDIHQFGGTILGASRGSQDVSEMVDTLEQSNINVLFCIGGDGTLRGAKAIVDEIFKRHLKVAVVGIPKTIDNDLEMVSRSFGFDSAVAMAAKVIRSAHIEALGAPYGVGLVKLMGRDSGFIAATAALAQKEANFVLIPEVDFDLEGPGGLLAVLEERLDTRRHAVIVVAEGAGQKFFTGVEALYDASGNRLHQDIGQYLADRIKQYFKERNKDLTLKYIDPSYIIRSTPAIASDQVYCGFLGQKAVHAAMAGKTGLLIGQWNDCFVHVPIEAAIVSRKKVEPEGVLWNSVLESTGQPPLSRTDRPED